MAVCADYKIPHSEFLEWDTDDRNKAIWWQIQERERCPSCGTRPEEWSDDNNAYIGDVIRCRGCEVRQRTEETVDPKAGRGQQVVLRKRR